MDEATEREAREVFASASAWLREWIEEGVDAYERPAAQAALPARQPAAQSPEPRQPGRTAQTGSTAAAPSPAADNAGSPATTAPGSQIARPAAPSEPAAAGHLGARPSLDEVREMLGECTRCGLCEGRSTIVFGDGNPDADLMFVGEGPGEQEDRQGLPFVGRAGELLTQMIERGIETPRRDVYICNIVKCRPPGNRTPLPDEVSSCRPFLDGQIDAVRPKVIVTLGKPAASLLLGRDVAITRERGQWREYRGIPLMPTLHPAYILRQYTPENRRLVWEDLKAAVARTRS